MCLKYIEGSLITYADDAIYHMLAKILKFSTTKMHCTKDNQEDFAWVIMWAEQVRGKKWTTVLGFVELKAKKNKEQSTNEPK